MQGSRKHIDGFVDCLQRLLRPSMIKIVFSNIGQVISIHEGEAALAAGSLKLLEHLLELFASIEIIAQSCIFLL